MSAQSPEKPSASSGYMAICPQCFREGGPNPLGCIRDQDYPNPRQTREALAAQGPIWASHAASLPGHTVVVFEYDGGNKRPLYTYESPVDDGQLPFFTITFPPPRASRVM
ncbi:MAG TPA: hypothetical protein PKG71_00235 [Candidatus Woesebacteria bacterium]|nr:hypothetical protein [Candidatus Woesebacteria bacterium]HNS94385.1 hypothetical protein [Candidatus Woesebacteria bacterium]